MIEGSVRLRRNSVGERRPLSLYYPGLAECKAVMWQFGARSLVPLVFSKCIHRWRGLTFHPCWNHSQLSPLHFKCSGNCSGPTV